MIVVVGLSHHTAPIEARERISLSKDDIPLLLTELTSKGSVSEAVVVSTCNRLELVATGPDLSDRSVVEDVRTGAVVAEALRAALLRRVPDIAPHLYTHIGAAAISHLYRVASSLDSLVVGEPQILGQVKSAFALAKECGAVGPTLERAINGAIRTAKRVRTETSIGAGQISVPTVAIDLARQIFGDFKAVTTLLVGSGEIAESLAKLMAGEGARLLVSGRNPERVLELTRTFGGEGRPWSELGASIGEADLVVSSTGAPGIVVTAGMVTRARRRRRGRNQLFIDLALPRDVAGEVEELDGVFLYNVDHLADVVASSVAHRKHDADLGERIVREETESFARRAHAEQAKPTIVALRAEFDAILKAELSQSLSAKLKHLEEADRRALERMLDAALNKLMHLPTTRLRQAATRGAEERGELFELTRALHELFGLGGSGAVSTSEPPSLRPSALGSTDEPSETQQSLASERDEAELARRTGGAR